MQTQTPTYRGSLGLFDEVDQPVATYSTFDELDAYLDDLQETQRSLSRVDRNVAEAAGDPPLRSFWLGVRRDLENEAFRAAKSVREEASRLSQRR